MIRSINIVEFLSSDIPLLDVRSPGEYKESHIIDAFNLPLLNDQHRELIGKCYKQKGQDAAIALGYELVNPISHTFIKQAETISTGKNVRMYCARGGLRSQKMAEFLSANGYEVLVLKGGYKAYRNYILHEIKKFRNIIILSGYTGSGKTEILQELGHLGCQVLDLEALANHKGSAFGSLGNKPQPGSGYFHNLIFEALRHYSPEIPLWVENESVTIGKVYLPKELWENMVLARGYEIELPISERVRFILRNYGGYETQNLVDCIQALSRRLGDEACRELCELTRENQLETVVERLFKYYDKAYQNGRNKKNCQEFVKISFETLDPKKIAGFLLSETGKNSINKT